MLKSQPKPMPSSRARTMQASEFKSKCLDIMNEVEQRHIEVVITKRGKPVAKLVLAEDGARDPFGFVGGTALAQGNIVSPDSEAWADDDAH